MSVDWEQIGPIWFEAAQRAAHSLWRRYGCDEDDAYQDCLVYLATHPGRVRGQAESGRALPGLKGGDVGERKAVQFLLAEEIGRSAARGFASDIATREALETQHGNGDVDMTRWANRPAPEEFAGKDYTPGLVEAFLPTLWGLPPLRSRPEVRTSESHDPSKGGNEMVWSADIAKAWATAGLTHPERAAVLLHIVLGFTQEDTAGMLPRQGGTTPKRQSVSMWADDAVLKLARWLNNGKEVC